MPECGKCDWYIKTEDHRFFCECVIQDERDDGYTYVPNFKREMMETFCESSSPKWCPLKVGRE